MNRRRELRQIAIADIEVGARIRPADEIAVEALAIDIESRGLRTPIEVVKRSGGRMAYQLVSGLHRYAACSNLGWRDIPAFLVTGTPLELVRDELLENLARNELSKLDRCRFLAELKRVHEEMNPSAGHGGDRRSADFQDGNLPSWSAAAAVRSGWNEETLKRAARIGERLDPNVVDMLRASPLADNQKELEALSKFGPAIQRDLATRIAGGEARSVSAAHRVATGQEKVAAKDPGEDAYRRLVDLWSRTPAAARKRFLDALRDGELG